MPTYVETARMYSGYYRRSDGVGYKEYPIHRRATALDYLLMECIEEYSDKPSTLLDVGCAFGNRVEFFRKRGFSAIGIDISEDAVKYGIECRNLDIRLGKYEDFEASVEFDVVTMIDFIEHMRSPSLWLWKTRSITHRGSLLLLLTPDFDCYRDYGVDWVGYNTAFEHVLFYNRRSLGLLLLQAGFEVVHSANIKTMFPTTGHSANSTWSESVKGNLMMRLAGNRLLGRLINMWMDINDRIAWARISSNINRQNSLLIVARRVA